MPHSPSEILTTPRQGDLSLADRQWRRAFDQPTSKWRDFRNRARGSWPDDHDQPDARFAHRQRHGAPLSARRWTRAGDPAGYRTGGGLSVGAADDRFVWEGEQSGLEHRVTLWLHPRMNVWLWRVEVASRRDSEVPCDAVLIQDLGLGDRGFLMNNEAYASQYLDHHVAQHPRLNDVLMSRQNLSQGGHIRGPRTAVSKAPRASPPISAK